MEAIKLMRALDGAIEMRARDDTPLGVSLAPSVAVELRELCRQCASTNVQVRETEAQAYETGRAFGRDELRDRVRAWIEAQR